MEFKEGVNLIVSCSVELVGHILWIIQIDDPLLEVEKVSKNENKVVKIIENFKICQKFTRGTEI